MEQSELLSSAASGAYEGEPETESGDTRSEGGSEETLNLVEGAILRTLTNYSEKPRSVSGRRLRGRLHNAGDEEQQSAVSAKPLNPNDMELLASLLEQVHELRSKRRPKQASPPPQEILKPGRRRGRGSKGRSFSSSEELRMTLEVATTAAQAAADAADTAAMAVARNTEAIEVMVNSMKSGGKKRRKSKGVDPNKAIVRSNERTHWALALMAITTIAWRLGVVRVAKQAASKLGDPLGYVSRLMGANDEYSDEKPDEIKAPEKGTLLDKLPHFDMPEIINNGPDSMSKKTTADEQDGEKSKSEETSFLAKSAAAVDVKTKEVEKTAFSFANLLHLKPKKT